MCYQCILLDRVTRKVKGYGLGRIKKPVPSSEGLFKLFYLSCMHRKIIMQAEEQTKDEEEVNKIDSNIGILEPLLEG